MGAKAIPYVPRKMIFLDVMERWGIYPGIAFGVGGVAYAALLGKHFKAVMVDDYKQWVALGYIEETDRYDLIGVDAACNYKEANNLGAWAIENSGVVVFHNTIAFPEIRRAVEDLAWESGRKFYEHAKGHGVGILVKE